MSTNFLLDTELVKPGTMIGSQHEKLVIARLTGKNMVPCFDQGPWLPSHLQITRYLC